MFAERSKGEFWMMVFTLVWGMSVFVNPNSLSLPIYDPLLAWAPAETWAKTAIFIGGLHVFAMCGGTRQLWWEPLLRAFCMIFMGVLMGILSFGAYISVSSDLHIYGFGKHLSPAFGGYFVLGALCFHCGISNLIHFMTLSGLFKECEHEP